MVLLRMPVDHRITTCCVLSIRKNGMKRLYWVADHLKPPRAFERLVGKQWSLLVLADYLEIVTVRLNEQRERVRQGAMEW